jgi:hypothetical protein
MKTSVTAQAGVFMAVLVNRHTTCYWQPPSSRQVRCALPHVTSLYQTEMRTKSLGISSVVFLLFAVARLLL